jgi:hypothetical protein
MRPASCPLPSKAIAVARSRIYGTESGTGGEQWPLRSRSAAGKVGQTAGPAVLESILVQK